MRKGSFIVWVSVIVMGIIWGVFINQYSHFDKDLSFFVPHREKPVVGVVLKALDSEHWKMMKNGAQSAGEDFGIELLISAPDKESNTAMQFEIIRDLIQMNVDALCVAPCDSKEIIPLLKEANRQGIIVITMDTDVDESGHTLTFVGTNNKQAGSIAAHRLLEIIDKKHAQLAIISGLLNQNTHRERVEGFTNTIKNSTLEIVAIENAESNSNLAFHKMSKLIADYPDLEGVFVTNAIMALGALEAIENNKKTGEIKVIAFDLQKDLLTAMNEGKLDSTISQDAYGIGYGAIESFHNWRQGIVSRTFQQTGARLITRENIKDYQEFLPENR